MPGEPSRRTFLRAGALGSLAVIAPALLSGCGEARTVSGDRVPGELGEFLTAAGRRHAGKTLNISCINTVQSGAIKKLLSEFEGTTGVRVNMMPLAENAQITKIAVTLGAESEAFDLYQVQNVFVPQYADRDWFVTVDELMQDPSRVAPGYSLDAYAPSAVTQLTTGGRVIAVPMFLATQVVYYRTDLFAQAGVGSVPRTFADLEQVCHRLLDTGVAPIALRGAIGATMNVYSWGSWLYGFGGNYFTRFDRDANAYAGPELASPEAIASVETYSRFVNDYGPPGSSSWAVSDITKAFLAGRVAMMQEGSPFAGTVNDPASSAVAGRVAAFPVPGGPAGHFPPAGAQGWAIPRTTAERDLAWLFAQWATHPQTLLKAALTSSFPAPPTPMALADPRFVERYDLAGYLDAVRETYVRQDGAPIGGAFTPTLAGWQGAGQEVSTQLNSAISGQVSAAEAMHRANEALRRFV